MPGSGRVLYALDLGTSLGLNRGLIRPGPFRICVVDLAAKPQGNSPKLNLMARTASFAVRSNILQVRIVSAPAGLAWCEPGGGLSCSIRLLPKRKLELRLRNDGNKHLDLTPPDMIDPYSGTVAAELLDSGKRVIRAGKISTEHNIKNLRMLAISVSPPAFFVRLGPGEVHIALVPISSEQASAGGDRETREHDVRWVRLRYDTRAHVKELGENRHGLWSGVLISPAIPLRLGSPGTK